MYKNMLCTRNSFSVVVQLYFNNKLIATEIRFVVIRGRVWGHKESDTTERLSQTELMEEERIE